MPATATSPARLTANRNNAKKSTGPKTEAGKRRSSRNAITHGCYAVQTDVLPGEDPALLDATITLAIRDLHPVGFVETALVESAMRARWRARRAARFETAVLNQEIEAIAAEATTPDRYLAATAYRRLIENSNVLQNLDRAETHAANEMHRSLHRLTEFKAQRLKDAAAIAQGIDPTKDPYDELFRQIEANGRPPGVEPILGIDDDEALAARDSASACPSAAPQNEANPAPPASPPAPRTASRNEPKPTSSSLLYTTAPAPLSPAAVLLETAPENEPKPDLSPSQNSPSGGTL